MLKIEAAADAGGLSYAQMMENAGKGVARRIIDFAGGVEGKRIAILVGPGNNGGDGLVAAHYLAEAGASVGCYLSKPRQANDANYARLLERQILLAVAGDDQRQRVLKTLLSSAEIVVDALLGTGFRLPLSGTIQELLEATQGVLRQRESAPLIVAVDCPSGLDCDSGEIAAQALKSDLTVTLVAAKKGLLRFPGAGYVGALQVDEIDVAPQLKELAKVSETIVEAGEVRKWLPARPQDAHKGSFGRVLIIAGSVNYPGAALLAAMGAYRAGAGLVTVAAPAQVQVAVAGRLLEATWLILPNAMGVIAEHAAEVLKTEMPNCQALVFGPGLGSEDATASFVASYFDNSRVHTPGGIGFLRQDQPAASSAGQRPPIVVDADGLRLLSRLKDWSQLLPAGSVLTPHPGEMAALTGIGRDELQGDRSAAAARWSAEWGQVVVLKGAHTVVANPAGQTSVVPIATSALASGGTGDVLAGIIGALLGQGMEAYQAAMLGVYLHGRAGQLAAGKLGSAVSVLAAEVAEALPAVFQELEALGG